MTRYTLIFAVVLSLLFVLTFTTWPPEEAREGSLYMEVRWDMASGKSIQPIFLGLPPEAGKYLGIWARRPEYARHSFSPTTVTMYANAAFENGCVSTFSQWTLVSKDYIEISEFDVTGYHPGIRCH